MILRFLAVLGGMPWVFETPEEWHEDKPMETMQPTLDKPLTCRSYGGWEDKARHSISMSLLCSFLAGTFQFRRKQRATNLKPPIQSDQSNLVKASQTKTHQIQLFGYVSLGHGQLTVN